MSSPAHDASRQVVGRGSLYTLGTAGPILAAALVTPAVTRLTTRGSYGVVATCVVVTQVTMMLASLGLPSVLTRHGILERSGVEGARALLVKGTGLTAAVVAVLALASPLWSHPLLHIGWRWAVAVAVCGAGAFAVVESCQALLRVLDRPLPFVGLSVLATLGGPLVGLLLLLLAGPRTPERYVAGLAVGYVVAAALGLVLCLRGGRVAAQAGDLARALRTGLPVVPHLVSLFFLGAGLTVVANHVGGVAAGGRVSVAVLVGSAGSLLTSALNNTWAPVVYRTDPAHRGAVVERTARDLALLAALAAGGVSLLAPWLLRLAAPSRFDTGALVPAVATVAFGSVVSVAYLANVHLVFASGRSLGLAAVTPVSMVVGIGVAALVASAQQVGLVAVGFPVGYLCLALGTALLRRRVSPTTWAEARLLPMVVLGAVLCTVGATLPILGATSLVRVILAVGVAAAAAAATRAVLRR